MYIDQNVSVGLWKERKEEKCRIVGWHMTEGMRLWGVTYKDMETLGHFHLILFISWFLSWLCWPQNNNTSHIFTDLIDLMGSLMVWLWHTGLKGGSLKRRATSIPVHSLLEGYSSVLWPSCSDKIYSCVIQCIRAIMWCHIGRLHYCTGDLLVHRADKHIHRCACKHLIINKRPFFFFLHWHMNKSILLKWQREPKKKDINHVFFVLVV